MERHITGSEVVTAGAESLRHDMYHCYPGSVQSYDVGTESANVQVMTNDVRFDVDTGARISEPWALTGVPVAWFRFAGFVIKGSLAAHDPVLLVAFDLDPTSALAAGRTLKPVDPADARRHGGGYWFALPINLLVGRPQGAPTGTLTIGAEGQAPVITISGSTIQLGASGGDAVALASKVNAFIHAVAGWSPVANDGGAALKTALAAFTSSSDVGSALIKAQ